MSQHIIDGWSRKVGNRSDKGAYMAEYRIINTWDQIKTAGGGLFICWQSGHGVIGSSYAVYLIDEKGKEIRTDKSPTAPWYEHGRKSFPAYGRENKKKALEEAKAWVAENYPNIAPKEWAKNRLGEFVDAEINKKFPIPKRED